MSRREPPYSRRQRGENDDEIQWVAVATAPDQLVAELWQQLLREESIPAMLAPHDAVSFLGVSPSPVRVMVPAEMRERAVEALAAVLGNEPIDPESPETLLD